MNAGNKCVRDLVFQASLPLILLLSVLSLGKSCQFPESESNPKTYLKWKELFLPGYCIPPQHNLSGVSQGMLGWRLASRIVDTNLE